jgi:hypothetical protein
MGIEDEFELGLFAGDCSVCMRVSDMRSVFRLAECGDGAAALGSQSRDTMRMSRNLNASWK